MIIKFISVIVDCTKCGLFVFQRNENKSPEREY